MAERAPTFYDVPAGAKPVKCRGKRCDKSMYFIKSPKSGRQLPVDCDVDGGIHPTKHEPGRGVSHYTTCVDVGQF